MRKFEFEIDEAGKVVSAKWDRTEKGYYCTNSTGEGIFYVDLESNSRRQYIGTFDFSVSGLTKPSARAKINRKA